MVCWVSHRAPSTGGLSPVPWKSVTECTDAQCEADASGGRDIGLQCPGFALADAAVRATVRGCLSQPSRCWAVRPAPGDVSPRGRQDVICWGRGRLCGAQREAGRLSTAATCTPPHRRRPQQPAVRPPCPEVAACFSWAATVLFLGREPAVASPSLQGRGSLSAGPAAPAVGTAATEPLLLVPGIPRGLSSCFSSQSKAGRCSYCPKPQIGKLRLSAAECRRRAPRGRRACGRAAGPATTPVRTDGLPCAALMIACLLGSREDFRGCGQGACP